MKMSRVPSPWASHSLMPNWLWFHTGKQYCSGHLPEASGMHWFLQSGPGDVELLRQRLCAFSILINTSKCSQNSCTDLFFPNWSSCFPTPANMWNHYIFTVSQTKRWKLLSHGGLSLNFPEYQWCLHWLVSFLCCEYLRHILASMLLAFKINF